MKSFATVLKKEAALVVRFRDTLKREQEILRSGSADELAKINSEKISLVDSLNQSGIERTRAFASSEEETVDMQAWFSSHPLETESKMIWEGLLSVAREARELNELNGTLLAVLHQKTSDALAILMNGNEADQSLYSSSGQAALSTGSRIIDSA